MVTGSYMVRCGAAQNKIGEAEKRLLEKGHTEFIAPLKAFLEIDIKNALVSVLNVHTCVCLCCNNVA